MKKVLAVVGSPRHGGNTDLLVDSFVEGARAGGAATEKVFLADLSIAPCDGCRACATTHECCIDDDMTPLYGKLESSDAWVLGTPVYFWGPTAQFKAFLDRWEVYDDEERLRVKGKEVVLISPFGDDDPHTAHGIIFMLEKTAAWLRLSFRHQILVTALDKGEVANNPTALKQAYDLGKALAAG